MQLPDILLQFCLHFPQIHRILFYFHFSFFHLPRRFPRWQIWQIQTGRCDESTAECDFPSLAALYTAAGDTGRGAIGIRIETCRQRRYRGKSYTKKKDLNIKKFYIKYHSSLFISMKILGFYFTFNAQPCFLFFAVYTLSRTMKASTFDRLKRSN